MPCGSAVLSRGCQRTTPSTSPSPRLPRLQGGPRGLQDGRWNGIGVPAPARVAVTLERQGWGSEPLAPGFTRPGASETPGREARGRVAHAILSPPISAYIRPSPRRVRMARLLGAGGDCLAGAVTSLPFKQPEGGGCCPTDESVLFREPCEVRYEALSLASTPRVSHLPARSRGEAQARSATLGHGHLYWCRV
jgi:hypothetical protein